jgi:cytochrome c oxidase subunit 4
MAWRGSVLTWLALMALLVTTVYVAYLPLGAWNAAVSVGIGGIKAALIVLFFMELWRSEGLVRLAAAAGLFWLVVMFGLTFSDFLSRI